MDDKRDGQGQRRRCETRNIIERWMIKEKREGFTCENESGRQQVEKTDGCEMR